MKRLKILEISEQEAIILLDHNQDKFKMLVSNVFCPHCEGSLGNKVTEIIDYNIFLETSNDIVLKGNCKLCRGNVARLIETGENPDIKKKVNHILKMRNK